MYYTKNKFVEYFLFAQLLPFSKQEAISTQLMFFCYKKAQVYTFYFENKKYRKNEEENMSAANLCISFHIYIATYTALEQGLRF